MSVWQCRTDIFYFHRVVYGEKMTRIPIGTKYDILMRPKKMKSNLKTEEYEN